MVIITRAAPAPPTVQITQSSASPVAGEPLTLNCSATIQEGIMGSPTLAWSRDGAEQATGAGSLSLPFTSLATSDGGIYVCAARLTIPLAGVDVTSSNTTTVAVQSMFILSSFCYTSCCIKSIFLPLYSPSSNARYLWFSKGYGLLPRPRSYTDLWHYFE